MAFINWILWRDTTKWYTWNIIEWVWFFVALCFGGLEQALTTGCIFLGCHFLTWFFDERFRPPPPKP